MKFFPPMLLRCTLGAVQLCYVFDFHTDSSLTVLCCAAQSALNYFRVSCPVVQRPIRTAKRYRKTVLFVKFTIIFFLLQYFMTIAYLLLTAVMQSKCEVCPAVQFDYCTYCWMLRSVNHAVCCVSVELGNMLYLLNSRP